jgi:hypothetical protein
MSALITREGYPTAVVRFLAPKAPRRRVRFKIDAATGAWDELHGDPNRSGAGVTALVQLVAGVSPERAASILNTILDRVTAYTRPMQPTVIKDYAEIRSVLNQRRKELGLSLLALDYASGVQEGYSAKIMAGIKGLGKISLPCLFQALKLEMVIRPLNDNPNPQSTELASST